MGMPAAQAPARELRVTHHTHDTKGIRELRLVQPELPPNRVLFRADRFTNAWFTTATSTLFVIGFGEVASAKSGNPALQRAHTVPVPTLPSIFGAGGQPLRRVHPSYW